MIDHLYHFERTPPGLKEDVIIPRNNDISEKFKPDIKPVAMELYRNKNFIYTIPDFAIDEWEKTDQLESLIEMIVKMERFKYSVEKWKITTAKIDMSGALVRETYYISPKALGSKDFLMLPYKKRAYDYAFLRVLNSVKRLQEYDGSYKNPEILLPCEISKDCAVLESGLLSISSSVTSSMPISRMTARSSLKVFAASVVAKMGSPARMWSSAAH